jgi:hypothetical protein
MTASLLIGSTMLATVLAGLSAKELIRATAASAAGPFPPAIAATPGWLQPQWS